MQITYTKKLLIDADFNLISSSFFVSYLTYSQYQRLCEQIELDIYNIHVSPII